jgi:hypothetical protein
VTRDVVGEELRRQPVDRVGSSRADRDERRGRPARAQQERGERDRGHDREGHRDHGSARMLRIACGRRPGEERKSGGDRNDRRCLASANRLTQQPDSESEQKDEAHRQGWLDERQWNEEQRSHLSCPAGSRERGPQHPDGPPEQAHQQRRAQRLLLRGLPGLEGLQ